jgi:hypothetical protein
LQRISEKRKFVIRAIGSPFLEYKQLRLKMKHDNTPQPFPMMTHNIMTKTMVKSDSYDNDGNSIHEFPLHAQHDERTAWDTNNNQGYRKHRKDFNQ